ncbi:lytic murein transglycosylase [Marinicauda pacifica]|uniref:lytic murein transglycosylase n=1 Tax=Marinicauda pacifica TaxID=1133559 RepID=UPI0035C82A5F
MIRSAAIALICLGSGLTAPALAQEGPFEDWKRDFQTRLAERGTDPALIASMLDGVEPDMRIIERDRTQPEYVRPVWEYIEGAASPARVANGEAAQSAHGGTLDGIEARFGVDPDILTAIWGLESAYGEIQGNEDIVRALATLAWEGRRRAFAEGQLFAVADMLASGRAERGELKGSWAGAMGQTQFIPTTYMETAVDYDGDGHIDIWDNEGDALGSAANLLLREGWRTGEPVVAEVVLPDDFDYATWNERASRPVAEWGLTGITRAGGGEWDTGDLYLDARLVIPAGDGGPAFLAFENFDAIMGYNNSTSYALGVSYLAKALAGGPSILGSWPQDNPPITHSQTRELQTRLTELGYDTQGVDGRVGPNTRAAIRAFQADQGMAPDGYPGRRVYDAVMAAANR